MYLSDSHPDRGAVWVFDYDIDDGVPSNRRLLTDLHSRTGRPDGAAVDCDGAYWTCANGEGALLRFTPDGTLDRTVQLPMREPTMCAFGGPDMRTLFVTSAKPQDGDVHKDPLGGAVIALQVGARGLADTPFPGIGSARHA
jgi:sugar lactone lactonase YvrE